MPHSEQLRRAMDVKSGHAALFCPPHPPNKPPYPIENGNPHLSTSFF